MNRFKKYIFQINTQKKLKHNFSFGMKLFLGVMLLLFISIDVIPQDIKKDITVVKPYQPSVSEAAKLNQMPVFNDTAPAAPKFNYTITTTKLTPPFQPRLVNAAKMAPEPLNQLYKSYVNFGIGNPISPLAEISISNLRSHENGYGIYLKHHSANGNIKLENGRKAQALYADNIAELYGKHIFKKSVLSGSAGYTGNKVNFYGYNTALVKDTSLSKQETLQQFNHGNAVFSIESKNKDSSKFYYNAGGNYDYFADKFKNAENHINFNGEASVNTNGFYAGIDAVFDHFSIGKSRDSASTNFFSFSPWISKSKGNWKYLLGIILTSNNSVAANKSYFYPRANFEFQVAPSILTTYIGADGFLKHNNYQEIANENPYILPGLKISPTNHKVNIFGGIKGEYSSTISYNLCASYSAIDKQYFYINDTLSRLGNNFIVVFDNIDELNFMGEFSWKASEKLDLYGKANFYKYSTFLQKPWQLPNFEMQLSAKYNLQNKILAYADLYVEGRRYAPGIHSSTLYEMKPFGDLNLKLEYRYTKAFSVYLQFRNLTASKYMLWSQYPVYRFQVMAGLTYSL